MTTHVYWYAARAVFTDENGHTYSSNLDTMGMTFQDFFHPPPVGKEVSVLVCGLVV